MKRSTMVFAASGLMCVSAAADDGALDGFDRTGETTNCVSMTSTNISAIDDETLLFRVGTSGYYLNEVSGTCRGASSNFSRFELKVFGTTICSGEIVKVVDRQSGIFRSACTLGEFEKLAKKAPGAAETDE